MNGEDEEDVNDESKGCCLLPRKPLGKSVAPHKFKKNAILQHLSSCKWGTNALSKERSVELPKDCQAHFFLGSWGD